MANKEEPVDTPPPATNAERLALSGIAPDSVAVRMRGAVYEGPLPPPQILAGYAQIDPSFPSRIVAMAEANAATERLTAERAQTFTLYERLVARLLGCAFALTALAVTAYLASTGHDAVAAIVGGTTIVGVVAALMTGKSP